MNFSLKPKKKAAASKRQAITFEEPEEPTKPEQSKPKTSSIATFQLLEQSSKLPANKWDDGPTGNENENENEQQEGTGLEDENSLFALKRLQMQKNKEETKNEFDDNFFGLYVPEKSQKSQQNSQKPQEAKYIGNIVKKAQVKKMEMQENLDKIQRQKLEEEEKTVGKAPVFYTEGYKKIKEQNSKLKQELIEDFEAAGNTLGVEEGTSQNKFSMGTFYQNISKNSSFGFSGGPTQATTAAQKKSSGNNLSKKQVLEEEEKKNAEIHRENERILKHEDEKTNENGQEDEKTEEDENGKHQTEKKRIITPEYINESKERATERMKKRLSKLTKEQYPAIQHFI